MFSFVYKYGLFLVVTICSLNISIWRKFQQKTVPHYHQIKQTIPKPAFNYKALLFASVFNLSSWIPEVVTNFISIFGFHISTNIFTPQFYLSNSFINPIVNALRIPEFKEALRLCCAVRREIKQRRKSKKSKYGSR